MGYSTQFDGVLKFKNEPTVKQLQRLSEILDQDCSKHPEWNANGLGYIDLRLTKGFDGIEHNDAEKTYDMPNLVNVVIDQMQKEWPEFELEGQLLAQGEEAGDVWYCVIENGRAVRKEISLTPSDNSFPSLNIVDRNALGLGEVFGIPLERQNELSDALDEMVKNATQGEARLVYTIDVIEYIYGICKTQEEFIYSYTNHIMWLARTGRAFTTQEAQTNAINKFGNPQRL